MFAVVIMTSSYPRLPTALEKYYDALYLRYYFDFITSTELMNKLHLPNVKVKKERMSDKWNKMLILKRRKHIA